MGLRIGHGFDAHRLVPDRPCRLSGVLVPSDVGPEGHSDGDVVLHAVVDALLGAVAGGDIGSFFGTDRPEYRNAPSSRFVAIVREQIGAHTIVNVDVTVVGSRPRVGAHREEMRLVLADLLRTPVSRVSIKASSGNGLGELGRGEGISATVVLLLEVPEPC